jgi:hypothetical protein
MGNYAPARLFYNEDGSIGPSTREITAAKNIAKFYNRHCPKSRSLPLAELSKKRKKSTRKKSTKKKARV